MTDEEARARVLDQLRILDTPPEDRFDRICQQLEELMGTPATYLSLIDQERQWFKASRGLGEVSQTPREGTFCDYAIQRSRPTVVLNALEDPLFARSPYVQEGPQVRFYAGFPLTVQGVRVGTLCALGFEPRQQVTPEQLEQFYELARQAEAELQRPAVERRLATVLRAALSVQAMDSQPPDLVAGLLNLAWQQLDVLPARWHGMRDQLSGDGMSILFGVPGFREDQVLMAAGCAVDMQRNLLRLNQELERQNLPQLSCAIAVHCSVVLVGQIGPPHQNQCTVVGETLSWRILEKATPGRILVSRDAAQALGELACLGDSQQLAWGEGIMDLHELIGVGELRIEP